MGLFSNTSLKVNEIETLIKLIQQRFGEYIAIQEKTPHKVQPSVTQMFGSLYDELFKLYYPNKHALGNQVISINGNRLTVAFFILATFKTGLSFEENMNCRIFKDETQRTFARTV